MPSSSSTRRDPERRLAAGEAIVRLLSRGNLDSDDVVPGIFRFAAMGLLSTAAYFIAALVLFRTSIAPTTASVLAMLVGIAVSFVAQSQITFRRQGFHRPDAVRFGVLGIVGLLLSHSVVWLVHGRLDQPTWLAAAAVCILVPVTNFLVMNFWVFVGPEPA